MVKELIATRYELLDRIGKGGAADVFRAHDTRLDRTVALKILREDLAVDPEFLARFSREAKLAASLSHPNVVNVHDFGRWGDTVFMAMEFVDGVTLKEQLRKVGRLEPTQAIDVASQVLAALAAAHARGLVHRDVKPQNVLLTADGIAKLTDFGIAQSQAPSGLTQDGTTVGTAMYMAPEQIRGDQVGPPTDLYAAGALLYEALTGRPPFEGGNQVEVAMRHLNETPRPPREIAPEIPPAVESVVLRALAKAPAERFQSADQMLRDLSNAALGIDGGATSSFPTARLPVVPIGAVAAAAEGAALAGAASAEGRSAAVGADLPWWRRPRTRRAAPLAAAAAALIAVAAFAGGMPELRTTRRPAVLSASVDPGLAATVLSSPTAVPTNTLAPATATPVLTIIDAPSPTLPRPTVEAPTAAPAAPSSPPPASAPQPASGASVSQPAAPAPAQSQLQPQQPAQQQSAPQVGQPTPVPPQPTTPPQAPRPTNTPQAAAPAQAPAQPTPTPAPAQPTAPPSTAAPAQPTGSAPAPTGSAPAPTGSAPAPTTTAPLAPEGGASGGAVAPATPTGPSPTRAAATPAPAQPTAATAPVKPSATTQPSPTRSSSMLAAFTATPTPRP